MICLYDVYIWMYIYIVAYIYMNASMLQHYALPGQWLRWSSRFRAAHITPLGLGKGQSFHGKLTENHGKSMKNHIETYGHIIHTKLIPKSNSTISIRSWWSHNNQTELIKFIQKKSSKFQVVAFTLLYCFSIQPNQEVSPAPRSGASFAASMPQRLPTTTNLCTGAAH